MRRLATGALLTLAIVAAAIATTGAAGPGGGSNYQVLAIFDDVASAVPGEDVKIAGAKVGKIESMDVTPRHKAAVTLKISDSNFTPFHRNAHCTIRPQSLIGEKYVECEPGTDASPALRKIPDGLDDAGKHLLPLANTSAPVDIDLINNIMRLPYRQRFSILLSDLGAGFAGRGQDLNELIHELARSENVPVLPFYATLEDDERPGRMRDEWTDDGDHPSIEGYRRLGELAFRLP